MRLAWYLGLGAVVVGLTGCAAWRPSAPTVADSSWAQASQVPRATGPWRVHAMPGKTPGTVTPVWFEGREALSVHVPVALSLVRQPTRVPPEALRSVRFSWWVPQLIEGADLTDRDQADSPVRLVLAFDGDRSRLSAKQQMMSELSRSLTGEELPYAMLMYVWSNQAPLESIIHSRRTDRIRKLVVDSGSTQLGRWRDHWRDIRADFERAYGEPPGALIGVGVMSDTDNTQTDHRVWYGPVRLD